MLGVWCNPFGVDDKHISANIVGKYRKWLGRSKNGHLLSTLNWLSYQVVLWSGIYEVWYCHVGNSIVYT